MARPVTMPERDRIRALRRAKFSFADIAAQTGRSIDTVKRHAGDIPAVIPRGRKPALTLETGAALLREADEGWSRHMLARRHGLAQITVRDALARLRRQAREAARAQPSFIGVTPAEAERTAKEAA